MTKFHPFFAIGTVGMVVVSLLHIFFALVLSIAITLPAFSVLYPLFFTFLILGVALTVKKQKAIVKV